VCYLAPFTFNWIPYLHGYYGFSGIWCWIRLYDADCNKSEELTFIVMFFYGPLMSFVLFNVFSSFFMALRYFRNPKYRSRKFSFVVILFPLTCGLLATVDTTSFIQAVKSNSPHSEMWWIVQVIVDNLRIIIPSSVVILASCGKSVQTKKHKDSIINESAELLRK